MVFSFLHVYLVEEGKELEASHLQEEQKNCQKITTQLISTTLDRKDCLEGLLTLNSTKNSINVIIS